MNRTPGFFECMHMWCTQNPTSGVFSGRYGFVRPLLIGVHFLPPSSVRKAPAAEIAIHIRFLLLGSRMIVCRPMPPAPGDHFGPVPWPRSPAISFHDLPPSVDLNRAASSTPA